MPRILTYNVHGCRGTDGELSPERIAAVIAAARPDVVALQELDVGRARSGGLDQAHDIARRLGMRFHFHPALQVAEERYGDAILSTLPLRLIKAGPLPGLPQPPQLEPRGALRVAVELGDGTALQVITTHLGLSGRERLAQVEALLDTVIDMKALALADLAKCLANRSAWEPGPGRPEGTASVPSC